MNPTYKVGDVVQIISEEEVRSHPTDDCGNFILMVDVFFSNATAIDHPDFES